MKFSEWLKANNNKWKGHQCVASNLCLVSTYPFFCEETDHLTPWLNAISLESSNTIPCLWCEECQEEVTADRLAGSAITCRGYLGNDHTYYIECNRCLDWILGSDSPYGPTVVLVELEDLVTYRNPAEVINTRCKTYSYPVNSTEILKRKLHLLGVVNKKLSPSKSCVYFVQAGESGPIKIGFTEKSLSNRIRSLQTGCPEVIRVLGTISGQRETELKLHSRFKQHRKQGEWFDPHPEILEYIQCTTSTTGSPTLE